MHRLPCTRLLQSLVRSILLIELTVPFVLCAQDSSSVSLSGRASLSAEYFSLSTEPTAFFYARRPANLYRMQLTPELRYGQLVVPFRFLLSSQQTNFTTSVAENQSFAQFIQNPVNIISCEPRWKWLTGHLGSYTPQWSELSVGDVQIFGLGADVTPGKVRCGFFTGVSQRAIEPFARALSTNQVGSYQQSMSGLKLGFGSVQAGYVDLNVVHTIDDTSSVQRSPSDSTIRPQEQLLVSLAGHFVLDTGVTFRLEGATSFYTRNTRSDMLNSTDIPSLPSFTPRTSSRVDAAAAAAFIIARRSYGLMIQGKYFGGGFISLGYPQRSADRVEFSAQPRFNSAGGALQANATLGYRINNVSGLQASTLSQILLSFNASLAASESWSFAAAFSNFGLRSTTVNDSARIQNVSRFFSFTPTYSFRTSNAFHSVSLNLTMDSYTDENIISAKITNNNTVAAFANYMLTLTTMPLSVQTSLSYTTNNIPFYNLTTLSYNISAGYALFNNRLMPGLRLCYSHSSVGGIAPDAQLLAGVQCAYKISSVSTVSLNSTLNTHQFGTTRTSSYTERYLQLMLSTQF